MIPPQTIGTQSHVLQNNIVRKKQRHYATAQPVEHKQAEGTDVRRSAYQDIIIAGRSDV